MIKNKHTISTINIPSHVQVFIFVSHPAHDGWFPLQKKRIILDDWVSINQLTGVRKPFAKNDQWSQQVLCTETLQLLFRFETEYHFVHDIRWLWVHLARPGWSYHALSMVSSTGPNHLRFSADSKKTNINYFSPI